MEDMEKAAQAQGISFEDFKQNMKNNIITQRVISQEVGGHITVSQQEIQQYYEQHKADMDRPEEVRLSEILISTQKTPEVKTEKGEAALPETPTPDEVAAAQAKAEQVYAMLQKGAKFDDMAKQYSNGPTSAVGGDLEYFKRGTLSKDLEEQTFAMKAGDYTKPIRTNQGFVILKVTEHQTSGIPALKDVETQIQEQIYMSKMQPALARVSHQAARRCLHRYQARLSRYRRQPQRNQAGLHHGELRRRQTSEGQEEEKAGTVLEAGASG